MGKVMKSHRSWSYYNRNKSRRKDKKKNWFIEKCCEKIKKKQRNMLTNVKKINRRKEELKYIQNRSKLTRERSAKSVTSDNLLYETIC